MTPIPRPAQLLASRRDVLRWSLAAAGAGAIGSLVGCSGGSGPTPASRLTFSGTTTSQETIQGTLDAYAETTGTQVTPTFAAVEQWASALRTQLQGGGGPDVFQVAPGASGGNGMAVLPLAEGGFLQDLSDKPWAETTPASFDSLLQFEGRRYSLNLTAGAVTAFYNADTFAKAGAEVPTTHDELLAACDSLKRAGFTPIANGLRDAWVSILITYAFVATTEYRANPDFEAQRRAGEVTFAGSGWEKALELYDELNQRGFISEGAAGKSYAEMLQDVALGNAGMTVSVTQGLPQIKEVATPGDISSFALPAGDDPDATTLPLGLSYGFAVNAKSQNPEQALSLLEFMAQPEQVNTYTETGGNLPISVGEGTTVEEELTPLLAYATRGTTTPYYDPFWPSQTVQDALIAKTQDMIVRRATPADVVAAMDEAYDAAL